MEKIKLAMLIDCLRLDGISAVVMNYCTHLDLDKFDITIISGAPVSPIYKAKCDELDILIVELPVRKKQKLMYYIQLNKTLQKGKFDICHVHGNSATSSIELFLAAVNGVKVRIMHCHTSKCQHEIIHKLLSPFFNRLYTAAFACSSVAGNWIFGKNNFKIITNAFETKKFSFDASKRKNYRNQMEIDDCLVIGHVGQINYQKNTEFSIKLFEKQFADDKSTKLLLVGNGRDKEFYKEYVDNSICRNKIIFYGESADIQGLLSAMDIFIFPSRVEGFGIAAIEAQINGLPCVISTAVPREVKISEHVTFLPIGESDFEKWASTIRSLVSIDLDRVKENNNSSLIEKYDISNCAKNLQEEYELLISKHKTDMRK